MGAQHEICRKFLIIENLAKKTDNFSDLMLLIGFYPIVAHLHFYDPFLLYLNY